MAHNCNPRGGVISNSSLAVVHISKDIIERCRDFANARIGMSEALYRARGEDRTFKMIEDIVVGCSAEFAVQQYMKEQGYECTEPDLSLHQNGQKSFSADLQSQGKFLHVKAQTLDSAQKYGTSWIFQAEDATLTLPSENGFCFFCVVEPGAETYKVDIKAAVYIIDILEAEAVSKPKVGRYAIFKKAIYLTDLEDKKVNTRRF